MKILIVFDYYEPAPSANGLCVKNLIQEFKQRGDEVVCLAYQPIGWKGGMCQDGVRFYYVKNSLFVRLTKFCAHKRNRLLYPVQKFAALINYFEIKFFAYRWPFISKSLIYRIYRKIKRIYKKECFDFIIGIYKPFETIYAAYLFKKNNPNIKLATYYLDAFAGGWSSYDFETHTFNQKEPIARSIEEKIDTAADLVISMESARDYWEKYPIPNGPIQRTFLMTPTYCPHREENAHSLTENKRRTRIALYTGSIYLPGRDPRPLLDIFLFLCKRVDIQLIFVGNAESKLFQKYEQISDGKILFLGKKSKSETLELQKEADFLVNIGNSQPNIVPCKIFEYAGLGKPIISTFAIDDEPSIPFLTEYQHTFFIDERKKDEKNLLDKLEEFVTQEHHIDMDRTDKIAYTSSPAAFADKIAEVFNNR